MTTVDPTRPLDVIVAGLGAHGSSAAYRLAARGASVLGFDWFARGHTLGSSGGLSRIIRLSYYEHPDYVPLLRRAWTLWRDLERESGETLLTQTGGLYAGDPNGELVTGALKSAQTHQLEHEVLGGGTKGRARAVGPVDVCRLQGTTGEIGAEVGVGTAAGEVVEHDADRGVGRPAALAQRHGDVEAVDDDVAERPV